MKDTTKVITATEFRVGDALISYFFEGLEIMVNDIFEV